MPASVTAKPAKARKSSATVIGHDARGNLVEGTIYFATGKGMDGLVKVTHDLPKGVRPGLIFSSERARRAVSKLNPGIQFEIIEAKAEPSGDPVPAMDASAYEPSLQAQLLARGVKRRNSDLVSAEGTYQLEQVRELMNGVTSQAVSKRVREGSVLAVPGPSNRRRYPAIQFLSDGSVVEGLKAVTQAFPSKSPWMLLNFLVNGDRALGGAKPIDVLKSGDVERVVESARRIGIQGA